MNNLTGHLFVIAAPSGAGKTSLVNALVKSLDDLHVSISCTTRPMRPDDQEGKDYFFISEEDFQQKIQANEFLEYATIYHHHYGTPKTWVMNHLKQGKDVILEIDWQGARQIHAEFHQAILIFIFPPSLKILKERLIQRGQDSEAVIDERLAAAQGEMSHFEEFDYLIVNDDFEEALYNLKAIVSATRLRTDQQIVRLAETICEFVVR